MKNILLMSLLIFTFSCGKGAGQKTYAVKEEKLSKYVNAKSLPESPNLTLDKSIVNNSYPIEIALYENNRFYYNLPNLGDGKGTWEYSNGKIKLKAKRTLFDMYIEILSADETNSEMIIEFSDRFGPTSLKMMNVNIE